MSRRTRSSVPARAIAVVMAATLVSASSCRSDPDTVGIAVPPSADQRQVVDELGQPARFTLSFVTDGSPSEQGRYETWHYDSAGITVSFLDGEQTAWQESLPGGVEGLGDTEYLPGWFAPAMTMEEFLSAVGTDEFVEQPVSVTAADGERLVLVQGAVAGFDEAGLAFVETVPLTR